MVPRRVPKGGDRVSSSLPGALIAALIGVMIAFLNYTLARKAALSGDGRTGLAPYAPVLRMVLDVGTLAAVYFAAPYTPWDRTWLLVGAVLGLTLPLVFFTPKLLREVGRTGEPSDSSDRPADNDSERPPKGGDA